MKKSIFIMFLIGFVAVLPLGLIRADDHGGDGEDGSKVTASSSNEDISKVEIPDSGELEDMMKPLDINPMLPTMKDLQENDHEGTTSTSTESRPSMAPGLSDNSRKELVTEIQSLILKLIAQLETILTQTAQTSTTTSTSTTITQ